MTNEQDLQAAIGGRCAVAKAKLNRALPLNDGEVTHHVAVIDRLRLKRLRAELEAVSNRLDAVQREQGPLITKYRELLRAVHALRGSMDSQRVDPVYADAVRGVML